MLHYLIPDLSKELICLVPYLEPMSGLDGGWPGYMQQSAKSQKSLARESKLIHPFGRTSGYDIDVEPIIGNVDLDVAMLS